MFAILRALYIRIPNKAIETFQSFYVILSGTTWELNRIPLGMEAGVPFTTPLEVQTRTVHQPRTFKQRRLNFAEQHFWKVAQKSLCFEVGAWCVEWVSRAKGPIPQPSHWGVYWRALSDNRWLTILLMWSDRPGNAVWRVYARMYTSAILTLHLQSEWFIFYLYYTAYISRLTYVSEVFFILIVISSHQLISQTTCFQIGW
jgi:hypothetical protein